MKYIIILFFLLLNSRSFAQKEYVQSLVSSNYMIKYKNKIGTSFVYIKNNKKYLVSAKHIFTDSSSQNVNESPIKIEIYKNNTWQSLIVKSLTYSNPFVDVIVFDLFTNSDDSMLQYEVAKKFYLTQDIYITGFPLGLGIDEASGFRTSFIKKGILSAFNNNEHNVQCFYLDLLNNQGFSGGPVFIIDSDKKVKLIGVVSSYINDNNLQNITLNSGITICHSIAYVDEIIKNQ